MKKLILIMFSFMLVLTGCSKDTEEKEHTIVFDKNNQLEYNSTINTTKLISRIDTYPISSSNIEGNVIYVSNFKVVCPKLTNVKKLGKVKLKYKIGDEIYTHKAKIVDTTMPKIKLTKDILEFEVGEMGDINEYYKITDNYDKTEDLKISIEGLNDLNREKAGSYTITITAQDSSNNKAKKKLLIKIKDTKKEQEEQEAKEKAEQEAKESESKKTEETEQKSNSSSATTNNVQTSNDETSTTYSSPVTRDYLFSDGYDMDTAPSACNSALNSSDRAGSCTPLQDSDGIYYGMRLTLN